MQKKGAHVWGVRHTGRVLPLCILCYKMRGYEGQAQWVQVECILLFYKRQCSVYIPNAFFSCKVVRISGGRLTSCRGWATRG